LPIGKVRAKKKGGSGGEGKITEKKEGGVRAEKEITSTESSMRDTGRRKKEMRGDV